MTSAFGAATTIRHDHGKVVVGDGIPLCSGCERWMDEDEGKQNFAEDVVWIQVLFSHSRLFKMDHN